MGQSGRPGTKIGWQCYNASVDWQRLERWITVTLYISGGAGLVILLTKNLAPDGTLPQWLAQAVAGHLSELGNISAGWFIIIILAILGGNRIMVSIFTGVDRYREWRGKNEQLKAQARAAGHAAGHAEGHAEGIAQGLAEGHAEGIAEGLAEGRAEGLAEGRAAERAAIRDRLIAQGLNPDDILPPDEPGTNGSSPAP